MLTACSKKVDIDLDIPGAEKYTMLYMPQATSGLIEKPLSISDSVYKITYSGYIGGVESISGNVHLKFGVEPAMVDSFNVKNGTNYELLPEGSYTLGTTDAVIQPGTRTTGPLYVSVKTLGYIQPFQSYLLPVSITDSRDVTLNSSLKTAYYLITGSYAPGEVPRTKVLSLGANAGNIMFDFNGSLVRMEPENGALLLYPETAGSFGEPRQIGAGWNIFNLVFYYGGNRFIARWADSGNMTQYAVDANGNFGASKTVGFGWNIFSKIVPYKNMLLGIDAAGNMTMYPLGELDFDYGKIRGIGGGWNAFTQIFAYENSLLAIDAAGDMYQYPLSDNGDFGARKKVGSGWDMYTYVICSGTDLFALDEGGELWRYDFNPAGFWPLKK